jgi:hypothetical protein
MSFYGASTLFPLLDSAAEEEILSYDEKWTSRLIIPGSLDV